MALGPVAVRRRRCYRRATPKSRQAPLKRHWHCNALEHACSSIATVLFADALGLLLSSPRRRPLLYGDVPHSTQHLMIALLGSAHRCSALGLRVQPIAQCPSSVIVPHRGCPVGRWTLSTRPCARAVGSPDQGSRDSAWTEQTGTVHTYYEHTTPPRWYRPCTMPDFGAQNSKIVH